MKICSQARTLTRWGFASGLFFLLLMVAITKSRAQDFTYTTNNGTITITGYNGPDYNGPTGPFLQVMIPGTINGLPVTSIGGNAFSSPDCSPGCYSLTNITIPKSVTSIVPPGLGGAFGGCFSLTTLLVDPLNPVYSSMDGALFSKSGQTLIECPPAKAGSYNIPIGVTDIAPGAFFSSSLGTVILPDTVTNIGVDAFQYFGGLTNITIPDSVLNIATNAFAECPELGDVMVGRGVTNIDDYAFADCTNLHGVYFKGSVPTISRDTFFGIVTYFGFRTTIYYLPGTSGWGSTFGGFPTVLWRPQMRTSDSSFGVRTNQFGFNVDWSSGMTVVIEACTGLANPVWYPLQTNMLTGDSLYFSDAQWTNYPNRFYRIRLP